MSRQNQKFAPGHVSYAKATGGKKKKPSGGPKNPGKAHRRARKKDEVEPKVAIGQVRSTCRCGQCVSCKIQHADAENTRRIEGSRNDSDFGFGRRYW
jgi:hypothetical protein